ncbi:DUF7504 family protein [Natronomonas amylolytica]|uniref:DUF7504 family protein n=1 Tax=Natronomonas amylolytica TaxID=3108498 RepID=UPI0030080FC6
MEEHLVGGIPDDATTVLVLSPTIDSDAGVCSALSARAKDILLVGYAGADVATLRERLAADGSEGPRIDTLDIGTDVEPNDLTGQGIAITEALSAGTEVCFDSLTALLQYADRERSFQFLHSLGERCVDASATIHYHLDPATTDDRTVAALSMLMDAVVDTEADELRVRPELQKD